MDFPMQSDQLERYIPKALVYAILWSFAGDGKLKGNFNIFKLNYWLNSNMMFCYLASSSK